MEGFDCPTCNRGEIVMLSGPGRRMRYRHIPDLEIPENLELPTCSVCGARWLDADATQILNNACESAYRAALTDKADQAIAALRQHIPQRDLERLLGVSAGLLSKLKNGKETSSPMAAVLMLLAEQPQLLDTLKRLWAMAPGPTSVVESGPLLVRKSSERIRPGLFGEIPEAPVQLKVSAAGQNHPKVLKLVA